MSRLYCAILEGTGVGLLRCDWKDMMVGVVSDENSKNEHR